MYLETADIETATEDYASRFSGPAGHYFLDRQSKITLSLLKNISGATVLDVGGGHAQLAKPLVEQGFEVTVTGSAESCRERLDKEIPSKNFTFVTCDNLALPFDTDSFDVVVSFRLLPHVTRWQELLAELCRVAKHTIIIDYPDKRSSNILYEQLFKMKKKMEGNTRPYTLFTRSQISKELQKNGFESPRFRPEFLFPMVIHRKLNNRKISNSIEKCSSFTGLTHFFGSPIILKSNKVQKQNLISHTPTSSIN